MGQANDFTPYLPTEGGEAEKPAIRPWETLISYPNRMDAEIKERWLADLRTPGRKQAKSYLSTPAGDCCLGRLCIIEHLLSERDAAGIVTFIFKGAASYSALPVRFAHTYGLTPRGVIQWGCTLLKDGATPEEYPSTLAYLNDNGFTFPQIADVIEYFL